MTDNVNEMLTKELLKNQRSDRRWRNIRFFIVLLVILGFVYFIYSAMHQDGSVSGKNDKGYVSLVRLSGTIFAGQPFSAKSVIPQLQAAFEDQDAKGVILDINSGGGSPVQSSIIYQRIVQLKAKYHKKVVVVAEDMLASGAYLVAMGGDKIYANNDSITGSIGVVMEGFGFQDAIDKIGVSRRVFTAGKNKVQLDPFEPLKQENVEKAKKVLDQVHDDFINIVTHSRGKRLKGDQSELFSGDYWTGAEAVKLGIVDNIGTLHDALTNEFDVEQVVDYSEQPSLLDVLLKGISTSLHLNFGEYQRGQLVSEI